MFENNNSVKLRALEIEDYRFIYNLRNNPEIIRKIVGNRQFISSEKEKLMVEDAIQNDKVNMTLAVCKKTEGQLVGITIIRNINWRNKSANWAGTIIALEHCNKGYATAAGALVLKFLFDELGINRVYSDYLLDDSVSAHLYEKMGFTKEGIGRQEIFKSGKYQDIVRVSILKREYDEKLKG